MKTKPHEWASLTSSAKAWPSIPELADQYGVDRSMVEGAVKRQNVESFFLDCIRVNPESWERYLASRYRPAL